MGLEKNGVPAGTPEVDPQLSWHRYFMGFALHAATRSKDTCQVGAVLVSQEGTVLMTGYNGPPKGVQDSPERFIRPAKYLYAAHAEANAIAFCARKGVATEGARLYTTHHPCSGCMKLIIQAGIYLVYYVHPRTNNMPQDEFDAALTMARETGVRLTQLNMEEP